jgi:hypothetical protein
MGSTTHSIDVNAPLRAVYNQWTQFEDFPRFMEGVVEIRQQNPKTFFWRVNVGGKDKHWEAEILEQVPDTRIVWESIDGTQNRGMIAFEPLDQERTHITLTMEYEPEGFLERAGDALGIPSGQVEGDLKRFRDFIEKRQMETGSWRGEIANGETLHSTAGMGQPDHHDIKSSSGAIQMEPQEAPSLNAETGATALSTVETVTGEMAAEENLPLLIAGSGSESFYDAAPLTDKPAVEEENTQFDRKASGLAFTNHQIAERAYALYVARGRTDGYALDDWLEAEKQMARPFCEANRSNSPAD